MKHYQKVKPTERLILKALVAKDDNPEITEAFSRALDFFDSYDKVEHTAHAEVMRKIYLNNNCYKYSNSTHGLPRKPAYQAERSADTEKNTCRIFTCFIAA